jgi:hypothetical protein
MLPSPAKPIVPLAASPEAACLDLTIAMREEIAEGKRRRRTVVRIIIESLKFSYALLPHEDVRVSSYFLFC